MVDALGVAGTGDRAGATKDVVLQPDIKGLGLDADPIRDGPFCPDTATIVRLIPAVAELPAFWNIDSVKLDTSGANFECGAVDHAGSSDIRFSKRWRGHA
jgi:hypothetical protein